MRRNAGLCLLFLLLLACTAEQDNAADDGGGERQTPVMATEITPRDLSRQISLSAPVEPAVRIRLASRVAGRVESVAFNEGDAVAAGEQLAQLDVAEEEAELERARAVAERAELAYRRSRSLLEQGNVTEADYQRARAERRAAQGEVLLWETRRDFGRILAPRDAVVAARRVEPGEAVSALDTLFELVDLSDLVLRPGVSELDVVHLSEGQGVAIRLDAMPEAEFQGRIRRIFPTAEAASRLVTVEIALPADAAERGVRPGFLGRVHMAVDRRPDALAVPASAVGEDGDTPYVYVISDDRLSRRTVSTGVSRGNWTEITEGLEAGEFVLATNPIDMNDGQAVRIVGWRG